MILHWQVYRQMNYALASIVVLTLSLAGQSIYCEKITPYTPSDMLAFGTFVPFKFYDFLGGFLVIFAREKTWNHEIIRKY